MKEIDILVRHYQNKTKSREFLSAASDCVFSSAGLAWLVIPSTWAHFSLGTMDFKSWRLFVVLCSVPSLTSALLFRLLMPESPKFLMEVLGGRTGAGVSGMFSVLTGL